MGRSAAASDALAGHHAPASTLSFREQFTSASTTSLLADCWMVPFEHAQPIRATAAFKGQRNFAGLWWCTTNQRHVGFESWCERDNLMSLDFDPDVTGISSQPFRIIWSTPLPQHSHVPDFFIRHADGTAVVIDVRPDERVKPADEEVFQATMRLCSTVGWEYQRLGALPAVYVGNLRWLSGYRHPRCAREPSLTQLSAVLAAAGAQTIGSLANIIGDPVITLPTLFHMMWSHKIRADLWQHPLCNDTVLTLEASA